MFICFVFLAQFFLLINSNIRIVFKISDFKIMKEKMCTKVAIMSGVNLPRSVTPWVKQFAETTPSRNQWGCDQVQGRHKAPVSAGHDGHALEEIQ